MVRKQLYLTKRQNKEIEKLANELDISFADIVRRVLDFHLGKKDIKDIALYTGGAIEDTD